MNKLLFILSLFSFYSVNAQFSFTDNFESYAVGDYIGEADTLWTTWSGTTGGTEDAQATDENSASGTNSIYFSSSAANDPNRSICFNLELDSFIRDFSTVKKS